MRKSIQTAIFYYFFLFFLHNTYQLYVLKHQRNDHFQNVITSKLSLFHLQQLKRPTLIFSIIFNGFYYLSTMIKKKLIVLTGAGISAESGIKTFRDNDGLWEGHDIMEVASPVGWHKNPALVLDFYNKRRKQLLEVQPNIAHHALAKLEETFDVHIITQNVDDLHERAGSTKVLHLHGELLKARSTLDENYIIECRDDIFEGNSCPKNGQLRPHIVWFGEAVPAIDEAIEITENADIVAVIGTSLQVYPAAGLLGYAPHQSPVFYIDPKPANVNGLSRPVEIITATATTGVPLFIEKIKSFL